MINVADNLKREEEKEKKRSEAKNSLLNNCYKISDARKHENLKKYFP